MYWKINGTSHITNNEIMVWFVEGWIVERNGHPINWVKATTATTKEKAQCLGNGTMNKPKVGKSSDVTKSSQRSQEGTSARHVCVKLEKDGSTYNVHMPSPTKPLSNENINKVEKILDLKREVWKLANVCFKQFEKKKKGLQDHLIGLKFSMEDRKLAYEIIKGKI